MTVKLLCFLGFHVKESIGLRDTEYDWIHESRCKRCGKDFSVRQRKSDTQRIIEAIKKHSPGRVIRNG